MSVKTLVVGASGQVGTQMLARLGEKALATSRKDRAGWVTMDLAALETMAQAQDLFDGYELDAVYCVGGMTWVDGCETQQELAYNTNAGGPAVLAAYARSRGLPYIFFSTDYVFDGSQNSPGPYAEDAPTNALSVYGKTKLQGEEMVLQAYPESLVLRTIVVYGPDSREMNYMYSLMRNLASGKAMKVPVDQVSTPTYNRDLIAAALGLVEAGAAGIYNVAGPELMNRLEFAQRVAEYLGLDASLLEGVPTSAMNQPAPRPLDSGLAIGKLQREYPQLKMRTLGEALEDCGAELRAFLERQPS